MSARTEGHVPPVIPKENIGEQVWEKITKFTSEAFNKQRY